MRKNKTMLGVLALAIGVSGIAAFDTDRGEAAAAHGECPAMSATVSPAMAARCPFLSARWAEEAKSRCPALKDRSGRSACPAQRTRPVCPGYQKKNEAEETRQVDHRKFA